MFPLRPHSKKPAVRDWQSVATRDHDQTRTWWQVVPHNVGIACGPSGLLVIDLDDAKGQCAPNRCPGTHHGRDVLAQRAAAEGEPYPGDTYTVSTPGKGLHLYFQAPNKPELRSRTGRWWRVDTRGAGGYIAAALEGEILAITAASTGQRHDILLRAAARLGGLVGGGVLDEHTAEAALHTAARVHIGQSGRSADEAALAHLSPAQTNAVHFFATIPLDIDGELASLDPAGYRPLRHDSNTRPR